MRAAIWDAEKFPLAFGTPTSPAPQLARNGRYASALQLRHIEVTYCCFWKQRLQASRVNASPFRPRDLDDGAWKKIEFLGRSRN